MTIRKILINYAHKFRVSVSTLYIVMMHAIIRQNMIKKLSSRLFCINIYVFIYIYKTSNMIVLTNFMDLYTIKSIKSTLTPFTEKRR